MKKEKIIKIIIIIIYIMIAIELFRAFLNTVIYPDGMGINFICTLPVLPISIFILVYAIKSLIDVIKNKTEITIIDKIVMIYFIFVSL